MSEYRIGNVTKQLKLSADTLRYYEKIGLLPKIHRTDSGIRGYTNKNLAQLRFIQRAQKMNFSLTEIKGLLQMREDPQHARLEVRQLTRTKLDEVETRLTDLSLLKNELTLLINLCTGSETGCPIIEGIDQEDAPKEK